MFLNPWEKLNPSKHVLYVSSATKKSLAQAILCNLPLSRILKWLICMEGVFVEDDARGIFFAAQIMHQIHNERK